MYHGLSKMLSLEGWRDDSKNQTGLQDGGVEGIPPRTRTAMMGSMSVNITAARAVYWEFSCIQKIIWGFGASGIV